MAQILTRQSFRENPKYTVLLLGGVVSALMGLFFVLFEESSNVGIVRLVTVCCIAVLVLAWCNFDSLERRQRLYPWLRLVIVVFGVFALFIYLFKSRGLKKGMRASGLALLSLSGLFVIMLLSTFLWAVVLLDVE
jgi:hypothetical protein